MATMIESPLARLSDEQIEQLGKEFDAIHDQVFSELGERDAKYIHSMIEMHRRLVVAARVVLLFSRYKPAWVAGTTMLSLAKILENMEIGHNVMHGQWDWMNDPQIHSSTWDWDTASTKEAWQHSHNYIHHTFTNIRGKDKDLGYEIMRIDPHQPWHPVYLLQPLYNLLLMAFFEWGVAFHDLDLEALRKGEKSKDEVVEEMKGIWGKARRQIVKDYVAFPLLSVGSFKQTLVANFTANVDPQRVVARDHLLRPLPRPDVHVQRGGGRGRDARRLVRAPAARRGEHRRQPAVPRDQRQPRLPGRAPPVPRHAEHALRRDRAAGARDLPALRPAVQHRVRSASSGAA